MACELVIRTINGRTQVAKDYIGGKPLEESLHDKRQERRLPLCDEHAAWTIDELTMALEFGLL